MITIDLRATYDGMKVSDKEFMVCIKAMKDMGFTDEAIQKKLDKAKMDEENEDVD